MRMGSSTFRTAADHTVNGPSADGDGVSLQDLIAKEWQHVRGADLIGAIRQHPQLLEQRSVLLNLAIDEYRLRQATEGSIDLDQHCGRFRQFGSSVERSIMRQLETQKYIDDHPGLLNLLGEPVWPESGESIANFQIVEELGRGGVARVYLCRELDVGNRQVVLKATPFGASEASILGRLSHPSIVPIFSTGFSEEHGLQYLCMPYLGRSTLSDLVDVAFQTGIPRDDTSILTAAARWLPATHTSLNRFASWSSRNVMTKTYIGRILSIGAQLADALEHAHGQAIQHGDLKPSNVLLCSDGTALLLDFNLSRDGEKVLAVCGGTLSYMPPEQLTLIADPPSTTDAHRLDARSDIYSFGALLYELLTGRVPALLRRAPIDSSTAAKALLQQLRDGVAPPRVFNPLVSKRLNSLIQQCLEFEAEKRPKSIAEVKQTLLQELRPGPSIVRQVKVRRTFYALIAACVIVVGTASAAYLATRPPQYLAHYRAGTEYVASGQFDNAVNSFSASMALRPDFERALAGRAAARVSQRELDLAISDFYQLVRQHDDAESLACVGYCLNLKEIPTAAIACYENVLESGVQSAAVYNNLGASYLLARDRLSDAARYERSEECLLKALHLLPQSDAVRLNLLRLETSKASFDPKHNPRAAWRHASFVLDKLPDDLLVKYVVGRWYAALLNREGQDGLRGERLLTAKEKSARIQFAELVTLAASNSDEAPQAKMKYRSKFPMPKGSRVTERFYLQPQSRKLGLLTAKN